MANLHEPKQSFSRLKGSSSKSFGLLFSAIFAVLTLHGLYVGTNYWPLALLLVLLFGITALTKAERLASLNAAWFKFALLLGRIVEPITLGIFYLGIVTPVALVRRLLGNSGLILRPDYALTSYWILRIPPGPKGSDFEQQG